MPAAKHKSNIFIRHDKQQESLTLHGSSHQTCKKCNNIECTIENSWWLAKEMPEKCRVFWWNKIWEIRASCWFY